MIYKHEGAARENRRGRYDPDKRAAQPSRRARCTEYLHDSPRHVDARKKVPAKRRQEIASMGGQARAATFAGARPYAPAPTRAPQRAQRADDAPVTLLRNSQAPPVATSAQKAAARAARAAASRPARRAAQRARKAAAEAARRKP
ncbi:MAG: hypothetical protein ABSC05_35945 [Candidatus Solibacter sp.]|jgi:hypothetical protein